MIGLAESGHRDFEDSGLLSGKPKVGCQSGRQEEESTRCCQNSSRLQDAGISNKRDVEFSQAAKHKRGGEIESLCACMYVCVCVCECVGVSVRVWLDSYLGRTTALDKVGCWLLEEPRSGCFNLVIAALQAILALELQRDAMHQRLHVARHCCCPARSVN